MMLRAHRQAWCWQDEWTDLTMEDIRQLEEETARMLAQKMAKCNETEEAPSATPTTVGHVELGGTNGQEGTEAQGVSDTSPDDTFAKQWSLSSRSSHSSQHGGKGEPQSDRGHSREQGSSIGRVGALGYSSSELSHPVHCGEQGRNTECRRKGVPNCSSLSRCYCLEQGNCAGHGEGCCCLSQLTH